MAINLNTLKFSRKRFLSRSFDKAQKVRARNAVMERHLEVENIHMKKLQDRDQKMGRRDRQSLIIAWKKSVETKSPEPDEWLRRQKSMIWREQARERITKRGRRPGPIIPAQIFAHDGSCHQLFFEKGEMRQKALTGDGTEKEEFLSILPAVHQSRYYHTSPRPSSKPKPDNNNTETTLSKSSGYNEQIKKPGSSDGRWSEPTESSVTSWSKPSLVTFEGDSCEVKITVTSHT